MEKVCTTCKKSKDLAKEFYLSKKSPDGKSYRCISCELIAAAALREKRKKIKQFLRDTEGKQRCAYGPCIELAAGNPLGLCAEHFNRAKMQGQPVKFINGENPIYIYCDCAGIELTPRTGEVLLALIDINYAEKVRGKFWSYGENGVSSNRGGRTIKLRRFIIDYSGSRQVIHLNHDVLDYRKENLMIVTRQEACFRNSTPKHNTSGIRGVSWDKKSKKWFVYLALDGKRISGGYHRRKEKAAEARRKLEIKYWGI